MGSKSWVSGSSSVLVAFAVVLACGQNTVHASWLTEITNSNPLNWWRFDETSGTTAIDHGSAGDDGEYYEGVTLGEPGLVGNAAGFDGTGYVLVEQDNLDTDWTVEAIFSADVDNGATSQGLIGSLSSSPEWMAIKAEQWDSTELIGYTLFGVVDVSFDADTPSDLTYIAMVGTDDGVDLYVEGEYVETQFETTVLSRHVLAAGHENGGNLTDPLTGVIDELVVYDRALGEGEIANHFNSIGSGGVGLQPGDADQNLEFNQLDLVQVQVAAKYLTGQAATWGEGDWNGGPGGEVGNPPPGDGRFDQLDIIAALNANVYLTGPYGALAGGGDLGEADLIHVPEPSTCVLLGMAVVGILVTGSRRRTWSTH